MSPLAPLDFCLTAFKIEANEAPLVPPTTLFMSLGSRVAMRISDIKRGSINSIAKIQTVLPISTRPVYN